MGQKLETVTLQMYALHLYTFLHLCLYISCKRCRPVINFYGRMPCLP